VVVVRGGGGGGYGCVTGGDSGGLNGGDTGGLTGPLSGGHGRGGGTGTPCDGAAPLGGLTGGLTGTHTGRFSVADPTVVVIAAPAAKPARTITVTAATTTPARARIPPSFEPAMDPSFGAYVSRLPRTRNMREPSSRTRPTSHGADRTTPRQPA
jgi:hypothetical protein